MNLTRNRIKKLNARLLAGELITRLAHDVGIPWQELWEILKDDFARHRQGQGDGMNLTRDQIKKLRARLLAGEPITRLAQEVGIPWQRLLEILSGSTRHRPSRGGSTNLTVDQVENIKARLLAGEPITRLAQEVGVRWQWIWEILEDGGARRESGQQQSQPSPSRPSQRQCLSVNRLAVREADGIDRVTFDSVGETVTDALADYAQNESNRRFIADNLRSHMSGHDGWANNFTKKMLLAAIANPPKKLLDAVEQMRQSLIDEVCPPMRCRRRVVRNQEFGDELTPELVLVRSLTPWERMSREPQPRKSVTIGVNLTVAGIQPAEHILWRGAAATALADILTQRGLNVEIVAFLSIGHMSSRSNMVVSRYIIKRADMPLDIGAASVALAEIAYMRLVCLYGLARHMPGILSYHLGDPKCLPAQDRAGIDYLAENIISRKSAVEWLRESVTQQKNGKVHV